MRIPLDESLPRRLRGEFAGHEVVTVVEAGWSGVQNGDLLRRASTRFDLFATADQILPYRQNLDAWPIVVAMPVARDTRFESLRPAARELLSRLSGLAPRSFLRCGG